MGDILELAIGFTAVSIGVIFRIPQMFKIYKLKSGSEISEKMLWIHNLSYIFYIIYSVLRKDIVYITSSGIGIIQNLIIFGMKRWYAYNEECLPT